MKYYIDKNSGSYAQLMSGEPPSGSKEVSADEFDAFLSELEEKAELEKTEKQKKDEVEQQKYVGFDYNGTMCSATGQDQSGLLAVGYKFKLLGDDFTPTRFQFENGNSLAITKDNFVEFQTQWMQFRDQFFAVEDS